MENTEDAWVKDEDASDIGFTDILNLADIQNMQDLFSDATGVASLITLPDGTPITNPSNFCRLCNDIIRKTGKGESNCRRSDIFLGRYHPEGVAVQHCLSAGLLDAASRIIVEGNHIATWWIGQVRDEQMDEQQMLLYADEIGADRDEFRKALHEVPLMSVDQFNKVSKTLFAFANEISEKAYNNLLLKRQFKRQEKAVALLRESEEKHRSILHTAIDGFWLMGTDGSLLETNNAYCLMSGYTGQELLAMNIADLEADKSRDTISYHMQKILKQGEDRFETRHRRKDGSIFDVEVNVQYQAAGGGYMVAFLQDITRRKQAEETLSESESQYRLLTESMKDVVWTLDPGTLSFLYISPSVERLRGFTPEEIMAAPFDAALTPEGVEIVKNRLQTEIAEFLAQGDTSPRYKIQELQQPCKDGSMVWTEVVSNLYRNQKNGQIEVLGVTRDISERKRAEEEIRKIGQHYQALIEKAPDGIVLLNESGNIKFASPAAKKTFEMEAQEQVDGNPADYVHPEDVQMVLAELARLLADPSYIPTLQYRFRDNAGNWKWVESTFTNLLADESVKSIVINFRDITHRKQAEEGLQESEALYRAILKASPDAITISDLEGRYLIVSPSALALSGCTREEEMVGHHLHEFLAPEDRERGSSDFALMVQGVKTGANEYHGLRMDGSIIDIEVNGGSILDTEGQLIRMVFVIRDISKRKQAELALIESEKKFKRLVSDMQVGVLLQGAQAEIELSNPKALEFLGITEDQLLGKTSFDPDWNVIHEDGSAFPGPTHPVPQAIAMRKAVRDVIMGVYRPALGNRAWLKVDAEPQFHADGTVQQVVCSFIDITELKQAEENLRESNAYLENLINYANAPIIVWDPGFHITRFNHAFESLTGRSESEVLGQSLEILFPAEQAENSMALIRRTLAGERWETVEIIIQHRDKSERTVLWNSATLFAPDGITPLATIAQGQEITERKQAEEALRETNAYLENLINYANAPIIVWDPEFRITRFNHAFESMTGRSETEVLGQSLEILFPAEQAENAMALIRKTLAGERWETVEIIIQHRDKFERTVLWNSATLFAPDGITPLATIAQGQDITERKQAETALRESEEKFREMAELLPQIVFETDAHGILTYVNKQAYKFLGYPEDYPIVGLNTLDLYTPESRIKALENIGSRISGKLAGKGNEYVMKRRDGSTFPALIYSSPILKENKPVGLRGIIIDITERKKAEEKQRDSEQQYRLLVETANEGILVVQETYLKFVNPMVMEMTGYSSDELLTRPFIGIVHPDDRALVWDNYMTRIKGEEIPPRYHFRIVKKDTSIKWFELSGVKIDWEGKPAALNFVTDITERVRAEQEIRLKNDELQKLNTEKDKFFSIIAHDLRSPFNGFLGLTQLMAEELPAMTLDQIQKIAVNMRNSAANLFQLLENLLEWSRMEQGLIPFNPKPIPLLPVINESLLMVMESAKNKGIDISCTVPEGLTVFADRNMFQTIVRNLASNAVKFTARGGKIALKAKPVADNFVEIAIHDTGIGMDREMLSKLFRIDEHTSRKGTEDEPSTGLGLLMCSDFIERHGGKIQVESETDKGSIFRFTVPGVAEPVQKQIFVEATSANISTVQLKKIKVLIAEDDEASAMFISIIVKPFSIEQFKVTTGVEAVDALRNHPDIDLVLMDIKMPEMDGFEATRRIRQFNQKVVIIAQTAFGLAKDREMALGAGCNDHIPKPLNQNTLVELLQKYFFKD